MKTRRVIKRKTSTKMVQTGYHTFKGKITAKMQMVAATGKKKSPSKKVNQSSLKTNVKKEKVLSSYDLLKTKPYKGGYREYTEADINEAIELVHGGMPVIDAALKYGIPRATLFNRSRDGCKTHSGRCSEVFGRTHVGGRRRAKAMQYTQEAVEKAIQAVHAGMPVIDASILYHIPRATLFVRSSKGCPSHAGRCATVFSSGKLRRTRAQKIMYRGEQQKQSRHSFSKLENEYYVISPGPGTVPRAAACTATRGQAVTINTEQNAFGNDWTNPEFVKSLFEVPKSTETLYPDKMSEPNVIVETPKPVVVKIEAIDL